MKRKLTQILLAAFFFSFQHQMVPGGKVMVKYTLGPFATEAACQEELAFAMDFFGDLPGFKVLNACEKQQGV